MGLCWSLFRPAERSVLLLVLLLLLGPASTCTCTGSAGPRRFLPPAAASQPPAQRLREQRLRVFLTDRYPAAAVGEQQNAC